MKMFDTNKITGLLICYSESQVTVPQSKDIYTGMIIKVIAEIETNKQT